MTKRTLVFFVGALIAAAFLLNTPQAIDTYDEGIVLTGAMRVLHGAVPHRDFYANYGPGQFVVLALLFKLFRPALLLARAWDAVVRAACVALCAVFARRCAGRPAAVIVGAGAFAWLAGLPFTAGYPLYPALAALLAALLCVARALEGGMGAAWGAGICLGIGWIFRYDVGTAALLSLLGSLAASRLCARRAWDAPLATMILWRATAGFALVVLPLLAALALAGAWPALWFDVVTYSLRNYAAMRGLPLPPPAAFIADPVQLALALPPLACAVAAVSILLERRRWPRTALLLCAALLTAALTAKGLVRASPIHISAAAVMMLPLLALLWQRARLPAALLGLGFAFCLAPLLPDELARARANFAAVAAHAPWFTPDPDLARAIAYVQANTQPGDPIFVGLPRHDRIFANDVAFYFLARRPPATGWYHFDPGLQTSRPIQRRMIADLARTRPKLVIIENIFQYFTEPNSSARSSGIHDLDAYIARHFATAAQFGRFTMLRPVRPAA